MFEDFETEDWIRFFTPLVIGYAVSFLCPIGKQIAIKVKARPPPWVFGVMWFILYLLIGYSWTIMKDDEWGDALWISLIVILNLWVIMEGCLGCKMLSLYVLAMSFTLALGIMVYTMTKDEEAAFYLLPLVGWLLFALMLSFWDFNC